MTVTDVPARIRIGYVMMMEAEEPLDEEHHQEPCQQPRDDGPDQLMGHLRSPLTGKPGGALEPRVRQQVKQGHAKHHAGDQADQELHAAVRKPQQQRNPAAR